MGIEKIVMSPAGGGSMICCYCFYPAALNDTRDDGWNVSATPEQLVETFKTIEPNMKRLFTEAEDIKMWRLYDHSLMSTGSRVRSHLLEMPPIL
jgi:salicylate hydroxylase